jgi:Ca2+-transporting ATPase
LPVHIVFLELTIDPASSMVFESERAEQDLILRPPRRSNKSLFGKKVIGLSLLQGLGVLAIVMAAFFIALSRVHGEEDARVLSFGTLIVANLWLIMTNLSWSRAIFQRFARRMQLYGV